MNEQHQVMITGYIKIFHPATDESEEEIIEEKKNAIHFENFSEALALSIGNKDKGHIYQMSFGNGGTNVDPTGVISYLPANTVGQSADLYNETYSKVVDDNSSLNTDTSRNNLNIQHTIGKVYTDIVVSCLLDYGEPAGQQAFDNSTDLSGEFVFDELGIKVWHGSAETLKLVTHVIFHPVQKSLNRQIQIDYTIRVQTLTSLSAT